MFCKSFFLESFKEGVFLLKRKTPSKNELRKKGLQNIENFIWLINKFYSYGVFISQQ